jgi:HAD superfamily hydrolase (TIGR01509 family)
MYQTALDLLGRPAERIMMIDDRIENVDAAVKAGMKGILFAGEPGLRTELAGLGVL